MSLSPCTSLIPRSQPRFFHLQCGKAGEPGIFYAHEHDVIDKWQKIQNEEALPKFCALFNQQ